MAKSGAAGAGLHRRLGGTHIHRTANEIGYKRQPDHLLDIDRLDAAMQVINSTLPEQAGNAEPRKVRKAINVYGGDLLESVYSDWCLIWLESASQDLHRPLHQTGHDEDPG